MKPEKGDKVKILFRNGAIESGIIESWTDKEAHLKSNESNNILLIQNVNQDVMAVKIILDNNSKNNENPLLPVKLENSIVNNDDNPLLQNDSSKSVSHKDEKFYVSDMALKAKKLTELRLEQAALEKEKIKNSLKSNQGIQEIKYDLPSSLFLSKNSSSNNGSR